MKRPEDSLWDPIEGQTDLRELLGFCVICGDPNDHKGRPHGEVTGDGMTRKDLLAGE